jgi:hypothetical protein
MTSSEKIELVSCPSNKFKKFVERLKVLTVIPETRHCFSPPAGGTTAAETTAAAGKSTETAR